MANSEGAAKRWYENNKELQMARNKEQAEKNPDRTKYLKARSAARSFIRTKATLEDLQELKGIISETELKLKNMV